MQNKCVFLDRDGVINVERGTYTFKIDDFMIADGVAEALQLIKLHGYLAIVVTNQSGISQGLYSREEMDFCHRKMTEQTGELIDDIFYCRWHPKISASLMRKPDSLMMERALALHKIDPESSWMVGDKERDMTPAKKLGIKTILVGDSFCETMADHWQNNLLEAVKKVILKDHLGD